MPPKKFDPEKAENFEDVRSYDPRLTWTANANDLVTIRWRSSSRLLVRCSSHRFFSRETDKAAVEHLMTYWSILEKVRGSQLRLTKMDDDIYEDFKTEFPEFDPAATVDEDKMKSKEGKEKWRNWMNKYEKLINDYNFGTIIRSNPKFEYDKDTTVFGMSCFLAGLSCDWLVGCADSG